MKSRGYVVSTILALALLLGLGSPVWAAPPGDPLAEVYANQVIPFYDIGPGKIAVLAVSDTSFLDFPAAPAVGNVDMFFFNQACNIVRDSTVELTENDVEFVTLNSLPGIPTQGEIFMTTDADSVLYFSFNCVDCFFITYLLQIDLARNTITRIDAIPAEPAFAGTPWLRYSRFNTLLATFGDTAPFSTTLTFFNAVGGTSLANGVTLGSIDTLREALFDALNGIGPFVADWVVAGGGGPCPACVSVTPGQIHLFTFDDDENPQGSFFISLRCFERGSLTSFAPSLAGIVGHAWAFSLDPAGIAGGGWSAFQETVLEAGLVDVPFSGYWHNSD